MVAGHRPLEHLWCTAPPSPDDHHGDLHAPPAAPRSQFDNTGVRVLTDAHMRFSSHGWANSTLVLVLVLVLEPVSQWVREQVEFMRLSLRPSTASP
jgi:hypothetical protein